MIAEKFVTRHNGVGEQEQEVMLKKIGVASLDELIEQTVPESIRLADDLRLEPEISEYQFLTKLRKIANKNQIFDSYIGLGYYNTILPSVIQRNILENPSWYTSYTPYQAEISQGRLEALLNFQTVVCSLTGLMMANASLLDEATAAAEAMIMMYNSRSKISVQNKANVLLVDANVLPQTLAVLKTRALPLDIDLRIGRYDVLAFDESVFGAIVQYPAANGSINDYADLVEEAHNANALVAVAADILSLTLLTPPAEWGADIVFGSTQRFGIPMGYGGPHAAYFAAKEEFKRTMPGRIIGVSKDVQGKTALRMSLQTREQHIKREKATSNICTAQALLATMAGMYAVYHGAEGLTRIAKNVHSATGILATEISKLGYILVNNDFFDTITIELPLKVRAKDLKKIALRRKINFNYIDTRRISISLDETVSVKKVNRIVKVFAEAIDRKFHEIESIPIETYFDDKFARKSEILTLDVFKKYHSETDMMRYIKKLERKDISLTQSMISLGSCTMKLNAATTMFALSMPEFGNIHPFVPEKQAAGYQQMFKELSEDLMTITGFDSISLQPNSGAAGEYAGLMVIKEFFNSFGETQRNLVLIPASAHGTNPASAAMAGMDIVVVKCDENGNIDVNDLREKAEQYKDVLAALMVTYPSTHGVFEDSIIEVCDIIHDNGGQVYMDGANMNAQVGLTSPAQIGADICHLNLHKTFAIPHGGGGPGVGPILAAKHLAPFMPSHPVVKVGGDEGISAVSAAPWGSALVYTISYAYIKMMGGKGLTEATKIAILNANYLAASLKDSYNILYTSSTGRVAHEMILDCRNFKASSVEVIDIAKRLMDYGFHAPTVSFPVGGTLMVEPTESESLNELNRFIEAMVSIRQEIEELSLEGADKKNNVLKNAPHTAQVVSADEWNRPYSRQKAAYPLSWIADNKFFPAVSRIDDAYGDRNLFCTCEPLQ